MVSRRRRAIVQNRKRPLWRPQQSPPWPKWRAGGRNGTPRTTSCWRTVPRWSCCSWRSTSRSLNSSWTASTETHPSTWWATAVGMLAGDCWSRSSSTLRLLPPTVAFGAVVVAAVAVADSAGLPADSASPSRWTVFQWPLRRRHRRLCETTAPGHRFRLCEPTTLGHRFRLWTLVADHRVPRNRSTTTAWTHWPLRGPLQSIRAQTSTLLRGPDTWRLRIDVAVGSSSSSSRVPLRTHNFTGVGTLKNNYHKGTPKSTCRGGFYRRSGDNNRSIKRQRKKSNIFIIYEVSPKSYISPLYVVTKLLLYDLLNNYL